MTFKAICDVIRHQGTTINELERVLSSKASKHELTAALTLKANVADVTNTVNEIVNQMDCKLSVEEA